MRFWQLLSWCELAIRTYTFSKDSHNSGNFMLYSSRIVCGFFNVPHWSYEDGRYLRDGGLRLIVGSLRSYDGNCNENVTSKLNFALSKVFCDYFMLVRLYKIGGVHFRLLGTNAFHLKLKNEGFTAASLRCLRTSDMKISRLRLADYVKTLHQKACHTCSTIIFLHSTNKIIDLWRCRWRCRRQILNSLRAAISRKYPTETTRIFYYGNFNSFR